MIFTFSATRTIFLFLFPFISNLAIATPATIDPNLDNPTPNPRGTISTPPKAGGSGCRTRTDRADTPAADAFLSNPTSEHAQTLWFYYPTNRYNLYLHDPSKYCNGTVSLSYPAGWAFKLEGITYSLGVDGNFTGAMGMEAHIQSAIEVTPGRGVGGGIYVVRAGEGTAAVVHRWVYPESSNQFFSLAEMAGTNLEAGDPLPVLTSACGREGVTNTVRLKIDTRAELKRRLGGIARGKKEGRDVDLEVRNPQAFDDLEGTPALRFSMVRLAIKWEACW
ncbi:hypothetical protein V8F20_003300 [Naviculisporaceae sp. PSN 640]